MRTTCLFVKNPCTTMLQPPISSLFETSSQNVDLSVERRILDELCQRLSQKVEFRIRFRIRSSIFRCPTLFRTRPLRTSAFYLRILIEPLKLIPVDGFCPKNMDADRLQRSNRQVEIRCSL